MTTTALTGIHVDALTDCADALASLRDSYTRKHQHILTEARKQVLKLSRDSMCADFNVGCEESHDDDGGGHVTLTFPPDWSEEQAERFAVDFLDLDLSSTYRGAGQWFQNSGMGRSNATGEIIISVSWGLDI